MMVTDKGQVTIPKAMRDLLGILPGTMVEFEVRENELIVHRAASGGRGMGVVQRMRGRGDVGRTTEQLLALTRGE